MRSSVRVMMAGALLLASAGVCSTSAAEARVRSAGVQAGLIGHWMRHGEFDGRRLFLEIDSAAAVFDTEADTIVRYRYRLRGATLELADGGRVIRGRVLKLTADSLVIGDVPLSGATRPMRFWRERR